MLFRSNMHQSKVWTLGRFRKSGRVYRLAAQFFDFIPRPYDSTLHMGAAHASLQCVVRAKRHLTKRLRDGMQSFGSSVESKALTLEPMDDSEALGEVSTDFTWWIAQSMPSNARTGSGSRDTRNMRLLRTTAVHHCGVNAGSAHILARSKRSK